MRRVRFSATFLDQLHALLAVGKDRFGLALAINKHSVVYEVIEEHLAHFPATGRFDTHMRLLSYPVRRTPFVVFYEFDDDELRMHFVLQARADRTRVELGSVSWDDADGPTN
jgi:plasmid stabilization system protein ParE